MIMKRVKTKSDPLGNNECKQEKRILKDLNKWDERRYLAMK